LKDLKAFNPIELAEFAVANHIAEEPAFKWWVSDTLQKQNCVISKVKKKYWKMTHKFGIKSSCCIPWKKLWRLMG
jgi:hypothetical protein